MVVVSLPFYTNLIETLASPGSAHGLITFLFSFITIAVILIVIIALLWMDKEEDLETRFTKAKDIIAILVRILGTIIGFYFGRNLDVVPTTTPPPRIGSVSTGPASAPAGATSTGQPVTTPATPETAPATPR
jgi:hypothetical protein